MIKPINCNKCQTRLGRFNSATGLIVLPAQEKIFGVVFECPKCGAITTFDGKKQKRKINQKQKQGVLC